MQALLSNFTFDLEPAEFFRSLRSRNYFSKFYYLCFKTWHLLPHELFLKKKIYKLQLNIRKYSCIKRIKDPKKWFKQSLYT